MLASAVRGALEAKEGEKEEKHHSLLLKVVAEAAGCERTRREIGLSGVESGVWVGRVGKGRREIVGLGWSLGYSLCLFDTLCLLCVCVCVCVCVWG